MRVGNGREEAGSDRCDGFRELVHARRQSPMRTAYLLTGDIHLAEELLRSVLTKVAGSDGRHLRDDMTTTYGMNVRTGEVRKTGICPVGNAGFPGIVM